MDWPDTRNILCVRLDSLGDVLMTTPAIRALREAVPGRRITLLTSRAGAAAARFVPEIDATIEFAAPWMKATTEHDPEGSMQVIRLLASRQFDAAAIFTVYSQNPLPAAHLCYLAGIPLRLAHCHENPYALLTDWAPDPEPGRLSRHEVRRQLDLVRAVGCTTAHERLSFSVPPTSRARAGRALRRLDLRGRRPLVIVHPGASAASRRYPPALFAAAINILSRSVPVDVLLTGDATEKPLVESVRALLDCPSHSAAGLLDLGELAAVIEAAQVLIANNTGPVHIAAALGTPVVDLYALTNPQHTPWQVESRVLFHDVPCRFCHKSVCKEGHHDCLRRVEPAAVAQAAIELLACGHSRASARPRAPAMPREAAYG